MEVAAGVIMVVILYFLDSHKEEMKLSNYLKAKKWLIANFKQMCEWRRNTDFQSGLIFPYYTPPWTCSLSCVTVCVCTWIKMVLCVNGPLLHCPFLGEAGNSSSSATGCSLISDATRRSCCVTSTSGQSLAPMYRMSYEIICVYPSAALLPPQFR